MISRSAVLMRWVSARQQDALAVERLIQRTTSESPGYDRDVLEDIDRLGWGQS